MEAAARIANGRRMLVILAAAILLVGSAGCAHRRIRPEVGPGERISRGLQEIGRGIKRLGQRRVVTEFSDRGVRMETVINFWDRDFMMTRITGEPDREKLEYHRAYVDRAMETMTALAREAIGLIAKVASK